MRAVALVLEAGRDAADGRQHRRELRQLLADEPLEPVDAEELGVLGERVLPDAERQLALEFRRPAVEHEVSPRFRACPELVEQPRLADPAFARERDHRAAPALELIERLVDGRDLRAPPEESSVCGRHCRQI